MKKNIMRIIPMVTLTTAMMATSVFATTVEESISNNEGINNESISNEDKIETYIEKFRIYLSGNSLKNVDTIEKDGVLYILADDLIESVVIENTEYETLDDAKENMKNIEEFVVYFENTLLDGVSIVEKDGNIYFTAKELIEVTNVINTEDEITVDLEEVAINPKPSEIYLNGTLLKGVSLVDDYFPARGLFEAMGYTVGYDNVQKRVTLKKGASYVTFSTNSDGYTFGRTAPILVGKAPLVKDGITYVPVNLLTDVMQMPEIILENGSMLINIPSMQEEVKEEVDAEVLEPKKVVVIDRDYDLNTATVQEEEDGRTVVLNLGEVEITSSTEEKEIFIGQTLNVVYSDAMTKSLPPINYPKSIEIVQIISTGKITNIRNDKDLTVVTFNDSVKGDILLNIPKDFEVEYTTDDKELEVGQTLEVVLSGVMTLSLPPINNPSVVRVVEETEDNKDESKSVATVTKVDIERKQITVNDEKLGDIILNLHDDLIVEYKDAVGAHATNWTTVGQKLEVEYSPIMTRSIPPINNPIKITVLLNS